MSSLLPLARKPERQAYVQTSLLLSTFMTAVSFLPVWRETCSASPSTDPPIRVLHPSLCHLLWNCLHQCSLFVCSAVPSCLAQLARIQARRPCLSSAHTDNPSLKMYFPSFSSLTKWLTEWCFCLYILPFHSLILSKQPGFCLASQESFSGMPLMCLPDDQSHLILCDLSGFNVSCSLFQHPVWDSQIPNFPGLFPP